MQRSSSRVFSFFRNVAAIIFSRVVTKKAPEKVKFTRESRYLAGEPKHFPVSKGSLRDPNGENKGNFDWCLGASLNIPNSNICETRLYFAFTAINSMSGKNLWAEIFGPKVGKVGYFQHFFQFFKYNFRNIHFRRKFLST